MNGEFIGKAPYGYLSTKNKDGKRELIKDKGKEKIIKDVFYLNDKELTKSEILKKIKEKYPKYKIIMKNTKPKFTFIDLFAGIGGFHIALESLGGECVYASEIDSNCAEIYNKNFNLKPDGDITKVNPKDIPTHDILCGGFPCQPFSISGKMKGFEDTRGTLFFNILEIIKEKNPKIVFLENVRHLKDHDDKNTLKAIIRHLEELGYEVSWNILNAKDFQLAQNRERIIIIASKLGKFDFSKLNKLENVTLKNILDAGKKFEFLKNEEYTILPKDKWKKQKSGLIFCGYRNKSMRTSGVRPNTEHLSRVHKQPNRIYHIDGTHPTIPSQESSGRFWIFDGKKVRKLTINECYKLQGFPDTFIKSNSSAVCYNQIGNAVAVPMIREVGKELLKQLIKK